MINFLNQFGERLLYITQNCREDMHEPDEQDLKAFVIGNHLDNAFGDSIVPELIESLIHEYIVIMERMVDGDKNFKEKFFVHDKFNLATLIALARIGAEKLNENIKK